MYSIKTNTTSFIWLIIVYTLAFFIMGARIKSFLICLGILLVVFIYCNTPLYDIVFTQLRGIRLLETNKDKERLEPIYEEVCSVLKNKSKSGQVTTRLYILNRMDILVKAYGDNIIVISQGATELYTPAQLKGLFAHEFCRIYTRQTKAVQINNIAGKTYILTILIMYLVIFTKEALLLGSVYALAGSVFGIVSAILIFGSVLFIMLIFLMRSIVKYILAMSSRSNELLADLFVKKLGSAMNL